MLVTSISSFSVNVFHPVKDNCCHFSNNLIVSYTCIEIGCCRVVLGFNATLTAKVISWRSVTHMCFLAFSHQYYWNFSFQSHRLLFSHASAKYAGKKSRLNRGSNSQPPGHESDTLTTEPSGRGTLKSDKSIILLFGKELTFAAVVK